MTGNGSDQPGKHDSAGLPQGGQGHTRLPVRAASSTMTRPTYGVPPIFFDFRNQQPRAHHRRFCLSLSEIMVFTFTKDLFSSETKA